MKGNKTRNKPEKQSQTAGQTQKLNPFSFAFLRARRKVMKVKVGSSGRRPQ